jgi:hypothetical protein
MKPKTPKMGRPPAGTTLDGKPEKTSEYPKLTVSIRPSTKARLDAATAIERKPAWRIVEEGITLYVGKMPAEDRRMVETIAKRTEGKRED